MKIQLIFALLLLQALLANAELQHSEEYQIFDGRSYNGLFYPNLDILEWGEPAQLQFQFYDKKNSIDISGEIVDVNGRFMYQFAIDLNHRGERRCRRVPAPASFKPGKRLHYYLDKTDKDMNNFIVSTKPMLGKVPYFPKKFKKCIEVAAQGHREKVPKPPAKNQGKDILGVKRQVSSDSELEGPRPIFKDNKKQPVKTQDFNWFGI